MSIKAVVVDELTLALEDTLWIGGTCKTNNLNQSFTLANQLIHLSVRV